MNPARSDIQHIAGYTPGEQPQESGWIKLNTNENPYPPSPRVVAAIKAAADGRLNIYPDPLVTRFRNVVATLFDVDPDGVLPANGSDENLTILLRTFVDPGELVTYPYPSYILYETLADIQGGRHERLPLRPDWSFDLQAARPLIDASKLTLVPNPNSPSGNLWGRDVIRQLVPPRGVLVLDEAYGDFGDEPHGGEILRSDEGRRIVVTRSLSKSFSLAGVRFGFAIADPALVAEMRKVKDSYNCDSLSIAAATAAMEDQDWMQQNAQRIRSTRARLTERLTELGFHVVPSQANFVWATHPSGRHEAIYRELKSRKILVRYMKFPEARGPQTEALDGLRITVGTEEEINRFLEALAILQY
jgi:histidinol-phosphate aminotransferase